MLCSRNESWWRSPSLIDTSELQGAYGVLDELGHHLRNAMSADRFVTLLEVSGICRSIDPSSSFYGFAYGNVLRVVGRMAEAEAVLLPLTDVPKEGLLQMTIGSLYEQSGRFPLAESHYRRAITIDSQSSDAWDVLGDFLYRSGRLSDAKQAFMTAATVSAPTDEITMKIAACYRGLAEYKDCARLVREGRCP